MNLLEQKSINKFRSDLSKILEKCYSTDQIATYFSQYLLGELTQRSIEDYNFFPNVTKSGIDVTVHVFFPWDNTTKHEFIICKKNNPYTSYNRAMGVV